jgi:hypothetical protein
MKLPLSKLKKAVEQRADRTIFNFADQPSLNGFCFRRDKKNLPGLSASDIAGMMGKQLDVLWMEDQ